jgi:hypothetical protein
VGISRERADIIYETLAHYFKSVEILQSSEDSALYGFDVFWDDGRGIAADAGEMTVVRSTSRQALFFLVLQKLTILINKTINSQEFDTFYDFFVYNLHTLSKLPTRHGSPLNRAESHSNKYTSS